MKCHHLNAVQNERNYLWMTCPNCGVLFTSAVMEGLLEALRETTYIGQIAIKERKG